MIEQSSSQLRAPLLDARESQLQDSDLGPRVSKVGDTSTLQTFFNLYNQIEGLGLLAIPYVFRLGGWGAPMIGGIVVIWSWISGTLLARSLYDGAGRRVRTSYVDIAAACFGATGRNVVATFQFTVLLGVTTLYLVLIAASLQNLVGIELHSQALTKAAYSGLATLLAFPLVHVQNLSYVAYLSMIGVFCLAIVMVAVIASSAISLEHHHATTLQAPDLSKLPQTFGMLLFTFSGHSTFPDHEFSMREPKKFPAVLGCTLLALGVAKLAFGGIAILAYGELTVRGRCILATVFSAFASTSASAFASAFASALQLYCYCFVRKRSSRQIYLGLQGRLRMLRSRLTH
jgi:vesicular inhibitory amino acid transporter